MFQLWKSNQVQGKTQMITEEHLRHWISEIRYALNGIHNEATKDYTINTVGIQVGDSYFSFEYLREKVDVIGHLLKCIEDDIRNDKDIPK